MNGASGPPLKGFLLSAGFRSLPKPLANRREKIAQVPSLIAALQASPYREIDIEPERYRLPVRDFALYYNWGRLR
jgi:hypothetical protein